MTEEQIKQNAEEYASKLVERDYHEDIWLDLYDAHIAGAHSRDEEVKQWKESKRKLRLRLMQKIHELRNPWISVEDRLPEKWKRLKVYQGTGEECYSWITKDVFVIKDGWETPEIAFYDYDAKIWWSEFGDNIENLFGEPTHWMPIPQIEKEEV